MGSVNPVSELIALFGGLRPLLRALGEKHPNLIQNWERSRGIPRLRESQVREGARKAKVKVPDALMARLFPKAEAA